MNKERYLQRNILKDLSEKMVFIGGARQVGKTTLGRDLISQTFPFHAYYNWDYNKDRKKILSGELPGENGLLVFDEIHKYSKWKNLIKGIYDIHKSKYNILVTGSARLNIYRKGGDSLQGRYHYYTLFPFSLAEMENVKLNFNPLEELIFSSHNFQSNANSLLEFGGFPEPLFSQDIRTLRRWHNEKLERLFREDIRDLENIRELNSMKLLADMLSNRASSPLSINNLRQDLEISHRAVTSWLNILESFYYLFRIYPYSAKQIRSIKKEPKLYLMDWSEVENEGAKFENFIAVHLLKFVIFLYESQGYKTELFYLRNVDKKEIDFLVTIDNKPWFAVEAKHSDTKPISNFRYFSEKLHIPFNYQVVKQSGVDNIKDGVRVISADKFLSGLV